MIKMIHYKYLASLCLLATTACDGSTVKDTLGLSREAPDEFRVVSRPPLSVPPQFNLRPPSVADESPNAIATDQQAKSLILGTTPESDAQGNVFRLQQGGGETAVAPVQVTPPSLPSGSAAESQLLNNAGADKVDPTIRTVLTEEKITREQQREEEGWFESLREPFKKPEPIVNAGGEKERLEKNKEAGKPVTEGETPETKPKDRGVLGRILGN